MTYQTEAPSVLPEFLRRDQRAVIYKPVPAAVNEMDMFFYDSEGKIIHSICGIKRGPHGLRYRTLPKAKSHLWPLVRRIRVFSSNPEDTVHDEEDIESAPEGFVEDKDESIGGSRVATRFRQSHADGARVHDCIYFG